ncbi:uncharacterized protein PG986_000199 [Apiospora aurea]|uniref:Adenylate kinase n=1 Tax=Apiospora aurea TaxID=335848 RepID=A0ABR1QTD6_9PEZI
MGGTNTGPEVAKVKSICILGPPGSGKSTLCRLALASPRDTDYTHLSVGDYLREICSEWKRGEMKTDVDYDVLAEHLRENKLLPADVLIPLLKKRMGEHGQRFETCWLIDGFPRTPQTARAFDAIIGRPVKVIILECARSVAETRFLSRRREASDDKKRFDKRYDEYMENMKAIRVYYEDIIETTYTDRPQGEYLADFVRALDSAHEDR